MTFICYTKHVDLSGKGASTNNFFETYLKRNNLNFCCFPVYDVTAFCRRIRVGGGGHAAASPCCCFAAAVPLAQESQHLSRQHRHLKQLLWLLLWLFMMLFLMFQRLLWHLFFYCCFGCCLSCCLY